MLYLKNSKRIIAKQECYVSNDGGPACEKIFNIIWYDDCARITVTSEEAGPVTYILYFDGITEKFPGW